MLLKDNRVPKSDNPDEGFSGAYGYTINDGTLGIAHIGDNSSGISRAVSTTNLPTVASHDQAHTTSDTDFSPSSMSITMWMSKEEPWSPLRVTSASDTGTQPQNDDADTAGDDGNTPTILSVEDGGVDTHPYPTRVELDPPGEGITGVRNTQAA